VEKDGGDECGNHQETDEAELCEGLQIVVVGVVIGDEEGFRDFTE
jgi:hypothetical protein